MQTYPTGTTPVLPAEEPRLPAVPVLIDIEQIQPHSATHPTGHLNNLGGRENTKFDHLDKSKNLSASPAGKPNCHTPRIDLPRLPRLPRTISPPRKPPYHAYHAYHAPFPSAGSPAAAARVRRPVYAGRARRKHGPRSTDADVTYDDDTRKLLMRLPMVHSCIWSLRLAGNVHPALRAGLSSTKFSRPCGTKFQNPGSHTSSKSPNGPAESFPDTTQQSGDSQQTRVFCGFGSVHPL
jgi:hypothetical protein